MLGKALAAALALLLVSPAAAQASGWRFDDRDSTPRRHHDSHSSWSQWVFSNDSEDDEDSDDEDSDEDESSDTGDESSPAILDPVVVTGAEQSIQAELTGYSYQDNTPAGSADICCPVLHQKAGGTGTFADPLTTAVPGSGGSGMEFPKGTKFYVPSIKRYVIVEDSGATKMSSPHLDIWVDGEGHSKGDSDACMNSFTGKATIVKNPGAGRTVTAGPLTTSGGCKI